MINFEKTPPKKTPPQPTKSDKARSDYFELQLLDVALESYDNQQYLKSAMMSWSFVEEYFLPTSIRHIAKKQNLTIKKELIENSTSSNLIKFYYLISYDEELYNLLDEARLMRNNLVHKSFKSGTIAEINRKAKKSSHFNLHKLVPPMLNRLQGKIVAPSLLLYADGWNDMRTQLINNLRAVGIDVKD